MASRQHIGTCGLCAGKRTGHAWRNRDGRQVPVCARCTLSNGHAARRQPCPRRCGPDGVVGPKCRLFADGHQPEECKPAGQLLQMRVRPEAVHA